MLGSTNVRFKIKFGSKKRWVQDNVGSNIFEDLLCIYHDFWINYVKTCHNERRYTKLKNLFVCELLTFS